MNKLSGKINEFGQPIGPALPGWTSAARPTRQAMEGRLCRVEPLDPAVHLDDLYHAYAEDRDGKLWTYMFVGPFPSKAALKTWLDSVVATEVMYLMMARVFVELGYRRYEWKCDALNAPHDGEFWR